MWIFLNDAFVSIVQDRDDPDMLMVRARLPGDLEQAFVVIGPDDVTETPKPADYRYRARLPREVVAEQIALAIDDITYTNFKDSVEDNGRHNTYLSVWGVMSCAQSKAHPDERQGELAMAAPEGWWESEDEIEVAQAVAYDDEDDEYDEDDGLLLTTGQ